MIQMQFLNHLILLMLQHNLHDQLLFELIQIDSVSFSKSLYFCHLIQMQFHHHLIILMN